MHNYIYTTLLSSVDYIWGVLILNQSLKKVHSKYLLIVCITTEMSSNEKIIDILNKENINYLIVRTIPYNPNTIDLKGNILNTASKIQIFKQTQFDKIIYIDADVLILQNIDDLFNYPNGSILQWPNQPYGMSGLFVFNPKYQPYDIYEFLIENMTDITDGTIIGKLFFPCLDNENYQIPMLYMASDINLSPEYKSIHYEVKPFLLQTTKERLQYYKYSAYKKYSDEYLIPLEQKYKKYLTE